MPKKIKVVDFEDIARGTTVTIPVVMHKVDGTPFDLHEYKAFFTLKSAQSDFDYDDDRALISKEVEMDPELIERGRFNVMLSSKETWLTPGEYYFDIVLVKGHSVGRLCLCRTNIVGGPNNGNVDHEVGDSIYYTNPITINPEDPSSIHVDTPLVTDPPENMIETIEADPQYILEFLDPPEKPNRHAKLKVFGPRLSLMMNLQIPHDAESQRFAFENFFHHALPAACPLKGGGIVFKNRTVRIETSRPMKMDVADMFVQHSPQITFDGRYIHDATSNDGFLLGDNVTVGQLHIQLTDGNDMVDISGNYQMHDDHGGFSYAMLTVNWYNWIDPDIEETDTAKAEEEPKEDGEKYPSVNYPIWPPNIHY